MKTTFTLGLLCCFLLQAEAQFVEHFSGKQLTSNNPWTGDVAFFKLTSQEELLFVSPKKDHKRRAISVAAPGGKEMSWFFDIKAGSITTSLNYVRFYLLDYLENAQRVRYYIQVGSVNGSIDLCREVDKQEVLITSRELVRDLKHATHREEYVRVVVKHESGKWRMFTNTGKESTFTPEGELKSSVTFNASQTQFMIETVNVKSRENVYYIDNIYIYPESVNLPSTLSGKTNTSPLPKLTDIEPLSYTEIKFVFSAPVDISQAVFSISGLGDAVRQVYGKTDEIVLTRFAKAMQAGKAYTISWKGVMDKEGRKVKDDSWEVRFDEEEDKEGDKDDKDKDKPTYANGSVLINEVMADPKGASLPETEYIELYNTTNQSIDLKDWILYYGERAVKLSSGMLPPNGYGVLYRKGRKVLLDNGGVQLPLSTFPASLANAGKSLTLTDPAGNVTDAISYAKAVPGKSWERGADRAWHLSTDSRGGTPGGANSAPKKEVEKPDPEEKPLPELIDIESLSYTDIQFVFSAPVDISQAVFSISGLGDAVRQVYGKTDEIVLTRFAKAMQAGEAYTISWKGVMDKKGRKMKDGSWEVRFEEEEDKDKDKDKDKPTYANGSVLINEVMADPKGASLPETEYVELYNTTDLSIDLKDWTLYYGERAVKLSSGMLPPNGYGVLYREGRTIQLDPNGIKLALSVFPAGLANTGKSLALTDPTGKLIDAVGYGKATPGKSWERGADHAWHLSTDPRGGTPGGANSAPKKEIEKPDPEEKPLPELIDIEPLSYTEIKFVFSASVDISQAVFSISGLGDAVRQTYGKTDEIVLTRFAEAMQAGGAYTISWKGVMDKEGRKVKDGSWEVRFEEEEDKDKDKDKDKPTYVNGSVLINEVMADPKGASLPETEYIELYNATDESIDLKDWTLYYGEKAVELPFGILPAKGYGLLYREGRAIQLAPDGIKLALSAFPAGLANTGKSLALTDPTGKLIDAVGYAKATPGKSWERGEAYAWHLSTDPRGGTPGGANSAPNKEVEKPDPENESEIQPFDIIINELLPDPHSGGSEYIELYNRSGKALPINRLIVSTRKANGELGTAYPLAATDNDLQPDEYIVFTSQKGGVTDYYLRAPVSAIHEVKLPVLANTSSSVVLYRKSDGEIVDEVHYSSSWHQQGVKNKKGISLERINPDAQSQLASNWTSASMQAEGGTPGYQNSQYLLSEKGDEVEILPPEYMELTDNYLIKYKMNKAGYFCRATIFDAMGRKIDEVMNNELLGTSGEIHWQKNASALKTGIYIFFAEVYHPDGEHKTIRKAFVCK